MSRMAEHEIEILPRVTKVETRLSALDDEVKSTRGAVERLSASVAAGFEEIRRDFASSRVPNWGWIISAASLAFVVGSAILVATVRPLVFADENHERRLERLEDRERDQFERSIRHDERIRTLFELKGTR